MMPTSPLPRDQDTRREIEGQLPFRLMMSLLQTRSPRHAVDAAEIEARSRIDLVNHPHFGTKVALPLLAIVPVLINLTTSEILPPPEIPIKIEERKNNRQTRIRHLASPYVPENSTRERDNVLLIAPAYNALLLVCLKWHTRRNPRLISARDQI